MWYRSKTKMTNQSAIEIVVQLERQDLTRANRDIAFGRFTPYKWTVFAAGAAILSAMFAYFFVPEVTALKILLLGFIGLVGWPAFLVAMTYLNSMRASKSLLESTPALKGPTHWLFSDGTIRVDFPTGNSHLEWAGIMRVRETATQFLLYPQNLMAFVIPKRFFSSREQVSRLREMIRRHVPTATLQAD